MNHQSYVYILANTKNTVFYTGVTSHLIRRIWEHKNNVVKGFTQKYNVHKLVYYEIYESIELAIKREKQLKNWHHNWKINLVKSKNLEFKDLYNEII